MNKRQRRNLKKIVKNSFDYIVNVQPFYPKLRYYSLASSLTLLLENRRSNSKEVVEHVDLLQNSAQPVFVSTYNGK